MANIEKRGVLNLDWAISLAIFTIFLTIFFMLVFPLFNPEIAQTSIIDELKEKFTNPDEEKVAWTVQKIMVYVSDSSLGYSPVSLSFPYEWNTSNSSFIDSRQFLIDEHRLFFFHSLKDGPLYMVSSDSDYPMDSGKYDLECTQSHSNTSSLRVAYSDSLISQIRFNGNYVAQNFKYNVAGTSSFNNNSFVCKYSKGPHNIYPMANSSMIFNYMDSGTLKLGVTLLHDHYHSYYDGSAHSIAYGGSCILLQNKDIIDFYDEDGIAFVSDNMDVELCSYNTTSEKLNISLTLRNPYTIILHDGTFSNISEYVNTRIELGALQKLQGLSYEKLKQLNNSRSTNYEQAKSDFGIAPINDFDWRVGNKTLQ
ncbi:hypothetical protein KY311_00100 [Candidatus Woesearchaeota archaeon]|nr:hypothetical protein [Candidatus Woesearchaeota archaeon]